MNVFRVISLGNQRGLVKLSSCDFHRVRGLSWALTCNKYASALLRGTKRRVYMHRLILGVTDPTVQVDHINGNGLDNRRENLRLATNAENQRNRKAKTCGFKGVCNTRKAVVNPWTASITADGVAHHLGHFASKEAAAWAFNRASKQQFGNAGKLNTVIL